MSLLITGATGFIGKALLRELASENRNIYILVRPRSMKKAINLISQFPNVHIISGNLTNINVLDEINDLKTLSEVTEIVHLGGGYDIQMSERDAYLQNVVGTQNILALSRLLPNMSRIHLVSSFSVIGHEKEKATADDYASSTERISAYSKSKLQSEKMARSFVRQNKDLKLIVYRPGIVVPDENAVLEKVDGPFYFIKNILRIKPVLNYLPKALIAFYPYSRDAYLPLISVTSVAKFMAKKITTDSTQKESSFFIVDSDKKSVRNFMEEVFFHFEKNLIIRPISQHFGKKINTGFGIIPKELSSFSYFSTKLMDLKTKDDLVLLKKYNKISVKKMIDQTSFYEKGGLND